MPRRTITTDLEDVPLSVYFSDFSSPLFQHLRKPRQMRSTSMLKDSPLVSAPSKLLMFFFSVFEIEMMSMIEAILGQNGLWEGPSWGPS